MNWFIGAFFIPFLFLIPSKAYSKKFYCQLNLAPPEKDIPLEKAKDFLRFFTFETQMKKGKKINFKDKTLFIWNKKNLIYINLKSAKKRVSVQTSYHFSRQTFSIDLSPYTQLLCVSNKKGHSLQKTIQREDQKIPSSGKKVIVKITRPLLFKYYTLDSYEMGRSLIFQKGKVYNKTLPPLKNENWCLFRIELKLNEDTLVPQNTLIPVASAESLQNNKDFKVYSYSFVDFATGKKGMETSRFVAFSLECKIKSAQSFSKKLLQKINNASFEIYQRP
jgi:hypothetical protein